MCRMLPSLKALPLPALLLAGGAGPLAVAFLAQFGFGLHPCHFCLVERYPYALPLVGAWLAWRAPRGGLRWRFAAALGMFGWLITGLIALVHSAIEQGWLHYAGSCVAQAAADNSLEALRASIAAAPIVACNEITAAFLGLSMATWNALAAFALAVLAAYLVRKAGHVSNV